MDKNLARKNNRAGLLITAIGFVMFGLSFVAAARYVSRASRNKKPHQPERRSAYPAEVFSRFWSQSASHC